MSSKYKNVRIFLIYHAELDHVISNMYFWSIAYLEYALHIQHQNDHNVIKTMNTTANELQ